MTVHEYLNSFIKLSRYAPVDINTDEKKWDMFLNGLNDDIQFQLFNTDYADLQHVVDKAIVIENKIKEKEKDGKRRCHSMDNPLGATLGPTSRSLTSSSSHPR
jgi:predicted Rossmann-fold nucleotide-binding protein